MSQMQLRIAVLRAALRCSRHRREVSREALVMRVDCSASELDAALSELAHDGLVRSSTDARLTMAGLAVAVATIRPIAAQQVVQRARSAA
ncbi:MAG TPA: hypothetical protein VGH87_08815 [Polyangiaceae bacterium]